MIYGLELALVGMDIIQDDPGYNCIDWVRLALIKLQETKIIKLRSLDHSTKTANEFAERKGAE